MHKQSKPNDEQTDQSNEANEKKLLEENEKLIEKIKIIDDSFKRALADSENLRIRKNKEIEDAKKICNTKFCQRFA